MHEHEKHVSSHKVKVCRADHLSNRNLQFLQISAVEQHILDKDELLQKMSALLDAANDKKASVEESLALVKNSAKEAEERVATLRNEIKKGNHIIAGLQVCLNCSYRCEWLLIIIFILE